MLIGKPFGYKKSERRETNYSYRGSMLTVITHIVGGRSLSQNQTNLDLSFSFGKRKAFHMKLPCT